MISWTRLFMRIALPAALFLVLFGAFMPATPIEAWNIKLCHRLASGAYVLVMVDRASDPGINKQIGCGVERNILRAGD